MTSRAGEGSAVSSFRSQLALRASLVVALGLVVLGFVTALTLRVLLDREVDAVVLNVASIQAASLSDGPEGEMHFHEWELSPDEVDAVRDLVQYAQVWDERGQSLLRSQYMTSDLPADRDALSRASAGDLVWARQDFEGTPVRTLFYPLVRLGAAHEGHVLQVAAPLVQRNATLNRAVGFFVALTLMLVLATYAGSWWLAGSAVRPVHAIIDQAEEIGARSLDRRIVAFADANEYRRLVEVLNTMLGRLQSGFDAQRRFTADASHELRSPLTAMRGEIEVALRRDREPGEYQEVLESTLEEVVRLSHTTEELLTLARSDAQTLIPSPEAVDVTELVESIVGRLRPTADPKGVEVRLAVGDPVIASVDREILGRVTWNLLSNAIKHARREVLVAVALRGTALELSVRDDGPGFGGVAPEALFERFYRADQVRTPAGDRSGTGLGLAIVRALAEAHGGSATAEQSGDGALFKVRLSTSLNGTDRST